MKATITTVTCENCKAQQQDSLPLTLTGRFSFGMALIRLPAAEWHFCSEFCLWSWLRLKGASLYEMATEQAPAILKEKVE